MKTFLKISGAALLIAVAAIVVYKVYEWRKRAVFIKALTGEIVFSKRDGKQQNIYRISADGTNEKLVFANDDKVNSNASSPSWSDDKTKIRFRAMKNGEWKTFVVDAESGAAEIIDEPENSGEIKEIDADLKIERGNLFVRESGGNEILVYKFRSPLGYDQNFSSGAANASRSPDKQYIIFESCAYSFCSIMIADRQGETIVELTDGTNPDWK